MPRDYIPQSDSEFDVWQANLLTILSGALASYGLVAGDLTALTAAQTTWDSAFDAHSLAQNAARSAAENKDTAKASYIALIRPLIARLQSSPSVSEAEKAAIAITVRDTTRTAVGLPITRPVAQVDTSQRLQHKISWQDELTPTSAAKPDGVRGAELFVKLGGVAPADLSECTYVATDTRSPYVYHFEGSDAGVMAHWMLRWVNTKGETGPISETVSATVGA